MKTYACLFMLLYVGKIYAGESMLFENLIKIPKPPNNIYIDSSTISQSVYQSRHFAILKDENDFGKGSIKIYPNKIIAPQSSFGDFEETSLADFLKLPPSLVIQPNQDERICIWKTISPEITGYFLVLIRNYKGTTIQLSLGASVRDEKDLKELLDSFNWFLESVRTEDSPISNSRLKMSNRGVEIVDFNGSKIEKPLQPKSNPTPIPQVESATLENGSPNKSFSSIKIAFLMLVALGSFWFIRKRF